MIHFGLHFFLPQKSCTWERKLVIYSDNGLYRFLTCREKYQNLMKLTPPHPGCQDGAGNLEGTGGTSRSLGHEGQCKQSIGYL